MGTKCAIGNHSHLRIERSNRVWFPRTTLKPESNGTEIMKEGKIT